MANIQKEFPNAFSGLNKKNYENLFKTRHKIVHTVNEVPSLNVIKYYHQVEKLLQNILEKHDKETGFYRMKIFALKTLRREDKLEQCYNDARKHYKKLISKNSKNLEVYFEWGHILDLFGKYSEAVRCYDEIIKLIPDNDLPYMMKAYSLENMRDLNRALECYNKIIEIHPDDSAGYYNKGLALYDFAEYKNAIKCFNKAIKLDQNMGSAYWMKGKSLYCLGEYKKSVDCIDQCIQLDAHEDPNVFLDFGLSLQKKGDVAKSIEYLVKSLLLLMDSDFYHTHKEYYFGKAWQGLGVHSVAIMYFRKILEEEPDYIEAYSGIGESLLDMGQYAESVQCFDNVLEVEPYNKIAQLGKKTALKFIKNTNHNNSFE